MIFAMITNFIFLTAMLANGRQSPRHKTPVEYWVETLRKTGSGEKSFLHLYVAVHA